MRLPSDNNLLLPLLLLLSSNTLLTCAKSPPKNAILLSQVESLTLRGQGAKTTHRRVPAVPQLKCLSSPSICRLHEIDTMRCENRGAGYDDQDIQWTCTASLPVELKLGSTDVVCEGYASRDDPYVLKGSCAVEYRLLLTDAGERKYPHLASGGGGGSWFGDGGRHGDGGSDWGGYLFAIIFVAILAWIIYSGCVAGNENWRIGPDGHPHRRGWGGGGGGGGGWGGGGGGGGPGFQPWNDAPPPYPGSKPSSSGQDEGTWRPGFWTGLASGAAAGYFAGGRNNNRYDDRYEDRRSGWASGWGSGYGGGGTSWGSGSSRNSSGSASSSSSSARHESTGFGTTSRR